MIFPTIANPWVILGAVAVIAGAGTLGYQRGDSNGSQRVQSAWDRQVAQQALRAAENVQRARDTETLLQKKADDDRKRQANENRDRDARLAAATRELQERPSRSPQPAAATAPGFGAQGWGTGTGLFRDDAVFLTGKADLWQRIRVQRDDCYSAYGRAQQELERLNAALAARP